MKIKVILDTNFLIYCARQKVDYAEEIRDLVSGKYELVVPEQVVEELENLKEKARKGRDKSACDLALQLLKKQKIKKIKIQGEDTDEVIINLAKKNKNIVCTLDREMRKTLRRVIMVNRKKKLVLIKQ